MVSTSTRNFPNRLGNGANVYLASAELASVASILGRWVREVTRWWGWRAGEGVRNVAAGVVFARLCLLID